MANSPILGIDKMFYPGNDAMDWLQQQGKRFTGLYLTHSPTDIAQDWIDKRDYLAARGWGFIPTYLGLQDGNPSGDDGRKHGKQAADRMTDAGFAKGSIIYFDYEPDKKGRIKGPRYSVYLKAWMTSVFSEGFYPGLYATYAFARTVISTPIPLTRAVWTVELANGVATPARFENIVTDIAIESFDSGQYPNGQIHPGCIATQYVIDRPIPGYPGGIGDANFDLSSSLVADPSNLPAVLEQLNLNPGDVYAEMKVKLGLGENEDA